MFFFSSQNASPDVCKVLVGNKIDCDDERVIDTDKGKSVGLVFFIIKEQCWSHKLFNEAHILQVNPRHYFNGFITYPSAATFPRLIKKKRQGVCLPRFSTYTVRLLRGKFHSHAQKGRCPCRLIKDPMPRGKLYMR